MSQYFSAGVMLAIGAVLLVLAFGFLDSGGVEVDEDNILMWDDYREIDDTSGILGTSGAIELVTIGGTTYVHAKDTGYGTIVHENGRNTEYKVERATADLIIMNGQSNAAYYLKGALPPEADEAPAPKIGTSYYFGQLADPKMNYQIQSIEGYALHDFVDPETGELRIGDKGPRFCQLYTEATGHKAIWLSMGIIAKRVSEWLPPSGSCWQYDLGFMEAFNEQLEQLPIDVDRTIMMWAQGESDKNAGTSVSTYKTRFMTFYEAAPTAWGHAIDKCYMIAGTTSKMGAINTALAQLADEHADIEMAVGAGLLDTFSVANGLMYSDDLHYEQQGENAIADAAARFVLEDTGLPAAGPAPIYLMQSTVEVEVDGTYSAPATVTYYKTDLSQGRAPVTWASVPGTSEEGTFTATGTATVSPSLVMPHAYPPLLIVTVEDGGDEPPTPPEPETYTVSFAVASDSTGYGTVSISSLADVVDGTTATIGQTIVVGSAGQCTATPTADTAQYSYAFAGWTGADDSSTQAPTTITTDTTYYAHFTRSEITPTPMDPSLFTYTVNNGNATVTGWAGTAPADGYDLYLPATDGQGHPLTGIYGSSNIDTSTFAGAKTLKSDAVTNVGQRAFRNARLLESVDLPAATSVGTSAFYRCTSLVSVSLPAVTSIGQSTFSGCTSLASVSLLAVTSIDNYAFDNCTSIENVTFGPLTSLGSNAVRYWTFYQADGTTVLSKTAANLKNSTFQGTASALIKVPAGAKSLSPEMEKKAVELATENELKARMLAALDVDGMDPDEIAKMDVKDIMALDKAEIERLKAEIQAKRLAETKEETI